MLPRSASGRCPLSLYSSLLLIGRLPSGPSQAPHTLSAPSASELGFPVELLPRPPTSFLAGTTGRVQLLPDDRGSRRGQEGRPGAAGHGRGCSWLAGRLGVSTPAGEEAREWLLRSARAGFPPALLGEEPLHPECRLQQPRVSSLEALAFRATSVAPQRGEGSLGTRLADNIVTGGERRTAPRGEALFQPLLRGATAAADRPGGARRPFHLFEPHLLQRAVARESGWQFQRPPGTIPEPEKHRRREPAPSLAGPSGSRSPLLGFRRGGSRSRFRRFGLFRSSLPASFPNQLFHRLHVQRI